MTHTSTLCMHLHFPLPPPPPARKILCETLLWVYHEPLIKTTLHYNTDRSTNPAVKTISHSCNSIGRALLFGLCTLSEDIDLLHLLDSVNGGVCGHYRQLPVHSLSLAPNMVASRICKQLSTLEIIEHLASLLLAKNLKLSPLFAIVCKWR